MRNFLRSFVYAGRGLAAGMRGQRNIRVMLALAVVAAALGFWLKISALEWALLALCYGLVLSLELVNTAGEGLVDLVCPDQDPDFGRIKDVLAAAVLVAALATVAVGLLIFLPKVLRLLAALIAASRIAR